MWRSFLALFLIPSLLAAQTPAPQTPAANIAQQPIFPTKLSQDAPAGPPKYQHFAVYDAIRQGTTEEVAIQFWPAGFVTVPRSPISGIVPLKLDLQPTEGLRVKKVEYPKTIPRKVSFQTEPIPVTGLAVVRLKLRADRGATLGAHILNGKITFQEIHLDSTLGPVQQLEVQIPITVVEHRASVHKQLYPFAHTSPAFIVLIILLMPVAIALFVPYMLWCSSGGRGTCSD